MILRLNKLGYPSWKNIIIIYPIILIVLFGAALWGRIGTMAAVIGLLFLLGARAAGRNTIFETALPIRGRDIFCSRLLVNLASVWLLLLTILVAIPFSHAAEKQQTFIATSEALLLITFGIIAIYSIRPQELKAPRRWQQVIGWTGLLAVSILFIQTDGETVPMFVTISAMAICALASVTLFWKTWNSIPESFQIASQETTQPKSRDRKFRLPTIPWMPILRAFFAKETRGMTLVPLMIGIAGWASLGIILVWVWIVITISRVRRLHQWLLSLPISRQKLFLPIVLISFTSFTLGSLIHFALLHGSAPQIIINLMAVAAMSLLGVLASEIPQFIRRRSLRRYLLWLTLAAYGVWGYAIWRWFLPLSGSGKLRMTPMDMWLGNILPASLPLLIVTAFAVVGILYWLAYQGFRRAEVGRRPQIQRIH